MDRLHSHSLGDLLREHRRSHPGKTAVVCGSHRSTYAELDERVNRLAQALRAAGFVEGSRILWLGQNCHRILEVLLAAAKLGGVLCPVNWRQSPDELAFVIGDVKPKIVLWQEEEIGESVGQARKQSTDDALWLQHDDSGHGAGSYEAFLASGAETDPDLAGDPPVT